ncbi:OmpA family protein [Novosphingobium sp. fls2-241-R2A-195]|jgi:OOP family OmpA-OmpF porin|uniref:OmpA family protein n=1 Tax=Novosphingobium sp. fls2-241-R2A-195 TaxID=3040296 RepID=UPI00254F62EA|nr:OmpA family protein [Novosphingobium sp. fls2-241-R2A-195]
MRGLKLPEGAAHWLSAAAIGLAVSACQPGKAPQDDQSEAAADASDAVEPELVKKSIIRAEIDPEPSETPVLQPETIVVPFPATGSEPDAAGLAMIDDLMTHPSFRAGGPITIWGHSDSKGSDEQNLAASRRRAEAVRGYLVKNNVPRDRITVIALGEARPIAPNRNLDGTDDMEGRAKNRRVEIKVDLPAPPQAEETPAAKPE